MGDKNSAVLKFFTRTVVWFCSPKDQLKLKLVSILLRLCAREKSLLSYFSEKLKWTCVKMQLFCARKRTKLSMQNYWQKRWIHSRLCAKRMVHLNRQKREWTRCPQTNWLQNPKMKALFLSNSENEVNADQWINICCKNGKIETETVFNLRLIKNVDCFRDCFDFYPKTLISSKKNVFKFSILCSRNRRVQVHW